MTELLRRHLWAVFLAHQLLIFVLAVAFLTSVRRITGRTIHGGRDPVGVIDGAALVVLSAGVIFITWALYRWVKGSDAPPLGIAPSPRRVVDLMAGILIGFAFIIWPYILALTEGTAAVYDRIDAHFNYPVTARVLCIALFLLLTQSIMEETANRAFPMRLWAHRPLWFRVIAPTVFFAALHLADEQFSFGRIGILLLAGIVQSLAYALTGNIWLTSGVHAGANAAAFSVSGLWHAGAVVSVTGHPSVPNWVAVAVMLAAFSVATGLSRRHKMRQLRFSQRAG